MNWYTSDSYRYCHCGRGNRYDAEYYSTCYDCYLDRTRDLVSCIYCGQLHGDEYATCFDCRAKTREEAGAALRLVILARDGFRCAYCGAAEGEMQTDPRLSRPRCPPYCTVEHNHRKPCRPGCKRKHQCRKPGDDRVCAPGCTKLHEHRAADDDGVRPVKLHIDHILPCAEGGTANPWNLQVLCVVCNVAKGPEWWAGSRHHQARRVHIAAYLTYLNAWVGEVEQQALAADAEAENMTEATAKDLVFADYARRVRACRHPRPAPTRGNPL